MKFARANKFNARRAYRCLACGAAHQSKRLSCMHCGQERVQTFDSQAEARHFDQLLLRQRAGEITDLQVHQRYPLYANGKPIGCYEADFTYTVPGHGVVTVDVKGGKATDTPLSKWKRRHFTAQTGIPVEVVRT